MTYDETCDRILKSYAVDLPPRMARTEGTRWLARAKENLRLSALAMRDGLHALSCFHAQQAAEFALKGVLIGLAGVHLLTHSLVSLASEAERVAELNMPPEGGLRRLEDHYLQGRYPNTRISLYRPEEAEEAYRIAEAVLDECSRVLEETGA